MTHFRPQILLLDNYDSFTYNLYDYFCQLGADCSVIRNDEYSLDAIQRMNFDALVLSPGPKTPKEAGLMMELIAYYHNKIPILGICLGHQGIGEYLGASLTKAELPMHGKTSVISHTGHALFAELPESFKVMRYHSLILRDIVKTGLKVIATTKLGEVMAVSSENFSLIGIQFHPESILTEYGLDMLRNWLKIVDSRTVEKYFV